MTLNTNIIQISDQKRLSFPINKKIFINIRLNRSFRERGSRGVHLRVHANIKGLNFLLNLTKYWILGFVLPPSSMSMKILEGFPELYLPLLWILNLRLFILKIIIRKLGISKGTFKVLWSRHHLSNLFIILNYIQYNLLLVEITRPFFHNQVRFFF